MYHVKPLEYGYQQRNKEQEMMNCVMIGIVAIVVVYLLTSTSEPRGSGYPRYRNPVSAMITAMGNVVSGSGSSHPVNERCASNHFPNVPPGMALLIDDKEKSEENEKYLREFLETPEKKAVIVVFAHWCPHCKNLINSLPEMDESFKNSSTELLLVNSEAVPDTIFQGANAVIPVKHYPFIISKNKNRGLVHRSLKEALEASEKDVLPPKSQQPASTDSGSGTWNDNW